MTLGTALADAIAQDARLIILRELALQVDGRLNAVSMRRVLDVYSISRSSEWIATQLNMLAELGAIVLTDIGGLSVASITDAGREHVEQRRAIAGVTKPSDLRG